MGRGLGQAGGSPPLHSRRGGAWRMGTDRKMLWGILGGLVLPPRGAGLSLAGSRPLCPAAGRQDFLLPVCASRDQALASRRFCLKGRRGT